MYYRFFFSDEYVMQHLTISLYCHICRSGDTICRGISVESASRWDPAIATGIVTGSSAHHRFEPVTDIRNDRSLCMFERRWPRSTEISRFISFQVEMNTRYACASLHNQERHFRESKEFFLVLQVWVVVSSRFEPLTTESWVAGNHASRHRIFPRWDIDLSETNRQCHQVLL